MTLSPLPSTRLATDIGSYAEVATGLLPVPFSQGGDGDVESFEAALRQRFGRRHAVCTPQARVGIYLALRALIRPGQEVICSPYTLPEVATMIECAGGRPVFADIERTTCGMSPAHVERLVGRHTGAVLVTHLHGVGAPVQPIVDLCRDRGIPLIEDAAQGFGTRVNGRRAGTFGDIGVYSLEMHKELTTWLGGVVVTDRSDVASQIRRELDGFDPGPSRRLVRKVATGLVNDIARSPLIFQYGVYPLLRRRGLRRSRDVAAVLRRSPREHAPAPTLPAEYRFAFQGFQARIGLRRLSKVDGDIAQRARRGRLYHAALGDIEGLVLPPPPREGDTYLTFPVQHPERSELLRHLLRRRRDVAAGHFRNLAADRRFRSSASGCPEAGRAARSMIHLPTYPGYAIGEIYETVAAIREFCSAPPLATGLETADGTSIR